MSDPCPSGGRVNILQVSHIIDLIAGRAFWMRGVMGWVWGVTCLLHERCHRFGMRSGVPSGWEVSWFGCEEWHAFWVRGIMGLVWGVAGHLGERCHEFGMRSFMPSWWEVAWVGCEEWHVFWLRGIMGLVGVPMLCQNTHSYHVHYALLIMCSGLVCWGRGINLIQKEENEEENIMDGSLF